MLSQILRSTLERGGYLPARTAEQLEKQLPNQPPLAEVILDGTERQVHRPQDKEEQKDKYSGEKKAHTIKIWYW